MLAGIRITPSTITFLFAASACVTTPARNRLTLAVPLFSQDSVTTDSTGRKLGALAGVVLDSASGSGLEGAQVILSSPSISNPRFAYTNNRGGFVIGRLEPGRYTVVFRRIGFLPFAAARTIRAGLVDTVTVRIAVSNAMLSTTSSASGQIRAAHYLTVVAADERLLVVGLVALRAICLRRMN